MSLHGNGSPTIRTAMTMLARTCRKVFLCGHVPVGSVAKCLRGAFEDYLKFGQLSRLCWRTEFHCEACHILQRGLETELATATFETSKCSQS